jgi:hypothetical protein
VVAVGFLDSLFQPKNKQLSSFTKQTNADIRKMEQEERELNNQWDRWTKRRNKAMALEKAGRTEEAIKPSCNSSTISRLELTRFR